MYNQKRYLFSLPMLESYSGHINCVGLPLFNDFLIILSIFPIKKNEINDPPDDISPDLVSKKKVRNVFKLHFQSRFRFCCNQCDTVCFQEIYGRRHDCFIFQVTFEMPSLSLFSYPSL